MMFSSLLNSIPRKYPLRYLARPRFNHHSVLQHSLQKRRRKPLFKGKQFLHFSVLPWVFRIIKTTTSQIITQAATNSAGDNWNEIKINNSTDTFNQTDYSTSDEEDDAEFDLSAIPELEDGGTFSPLLSQESSQKSQHSQQSAANTLDETEDLNLLIHDQSRNLFSTQKTDIISSQ